MGQRAASATSLRIQNREEEPAQQTIVPSFRGAWASQRVAEGNTREFKKNCRALHKGRNILKHPCILGAHQLESSFPKGLSVLGNNNRSQQYTLEAKSIPSCMRILPVQ